VKSEAPSGTRPGRTVDDVPLALLVAVLLLIGTGVSLEDDFEISLTGSGPWPSAPNSEGLLLVLAGSLPLIVRRKAPLLVFALTAAASMTYQVLGLSPQPLRLGALVALYTLAVVRRPQICMLAATVYVIAFTVGSLSGWAPLTDDQYYIDLVSVVATVTVGYGVALGRTRTALAERTAAEFAREQADRTKAAVAQEQARIAREVHDIVAHDLSVMVAQAGAARRVVRSTPQRAATALASIEGVGRDALDGLRRLVTLLRTDGGRADRSPQPSLDRLPWVLAQVQRAGVPVELTIRGRPRGLSATVELSAYRIVQEALTNVLKHAGPARASVVLEYGEDDLRVEVRDDGRGSAARPSAGYGLVSMQQRAAMLGGEVVAGPVERGFVVSARLPLTESDRRSEAMPASQGELDPPREPVGHGAP
jgi:signal transduction histidine kinase